MLIPPTMMAVLGVLAIGGVHLVRRAGVQSWSDTFLAGKTSLTGLTASMHKRLAALDDRYQQALQRRIDKLASGGRHAQWQQVAGKQALLEISPEDKLYNRRIARLSGVVVTATLAKLYSPFLLLTIPLAFYDVIVEIRLRLTELKQERRLKMEHLFIPFIIGMWCMGYFVIGGLSSLAYSFIMKLTLQSQDRTRREMTNILGEQSHSVWVLVNEVEVEIPFERLQTGDILLVQAGQMIPVDGVITQGEAAIDQQRLTGESQPVEKSAGDPVLAATLILSGKLQVRVEKTGEATLAAQVGDILANTIDYHLSIEQRGRTIADRWTLPSVLMTGLAGVTLGMRSAVAVLSNMPGIDMIFLGPLTLLNYLNLASRHDILVKDGRSLELLHQVDTVIFDKTGTLTLEQPEVKTIHLCTDTGRVPPLDEDTVLTYAAAAEQRQGHPIAKAILTAAEVRGLVLPAVQDADYALGYGLRVWLLGEHQATEPQIRVGSARFMDMESVAIPAEVTAIQTASETLGHSLVMVAVDDTLVGVIELQPTIRPEAAEVIAALHARNLETVIISGDQEAPTRTLAHELGIDRYFANVLPEEKAAFIEQLQAVGQTVCFVGDGINDAIALKKAEVSISLRGATTIATDTAQIVLMGQTLRNVPKLFDLSRELERNLKTSLYLVTVPCFFVIGGVFFLHAGIPLAVSAYTATFAAGVGNAMSPMFRHRLTKQEKT